MGLDYLNHKILIELLVLGRHLETLLLRVYYLL